MIFTDLFENRKQHPTGTVRVVEQDEPTPKPFKKTMVKPQEAYKLLAGQEPKAFAIDVLMPDQSAVKRLQAAIGNQAKIRGDDSIAGDGMGIQIVTPVFPDGRAAQQAFEMMMDLIRTHGGEFNRSTGAIIATPASQDMAEGHADQQRKIIKKAGRPVGEIGIDRESSPGVGQYYMKHYASGTDLSGYDSREEAMDELRYAVKQGVSEAMKPSDIPPSMRDRLTMRDIEAERPEGAYRFRVTFPDGATADFMDFEAAQERAAADRGRISRLSEEQKKNNPRIERILKMLRARHPQAEDDLEALIYDFRGQQAQDRSDISRLDAENDAEEADIERLEKMLDLVRRRRGAAAAEPAMAAESLRDDEYHVATVTLDDGSVKRVRITTDEGFRDRIQQHFKKQGRQVTDIDVDYAVRSNFSEETPRFVGAPARPQPQPVGTTKVLPPAPGRPGFVNKPVQETKKKPQPTNPELWSRAKAAARSKFDVWPSAYASAWAAKYYKSKGGGWRMGKPKKD